jgi:integrase
MGKLTALSVSQAKKPGYYADGNGLYLSVKGNSKSWVFRFRDRGRLREMGLGALHTIGLARAREKARECREMRLDGKDPIAVRRADRQRQQNVLTFKECAERYIAVHKAGWRNAKHAKQWPATLSDYVYPVVGSLPVDAIDTGLVMRALSPIWTTKPETASRVRGRIESILDWAKAHGYRDGENPARWRGHLENLLPKKTKVRRVEHHAALPYAELPRFMAELRQQEGVAARALEFLILTAARTGEVVGAEWSEIDFKARLWTVPGSRMKAGREHRVPLSEPALAILEACRSATTVPDRQGRDAHAATADGSQRFDGPRLQGDVYRLVRRNDQYATRGSPDGIGAYCRRRSRASLSAI